SVAGSSVVTGAGAPPAAGTRRITRWAVAKRIVPSLFHVPPRAGPSALHSVCGGPPDTSSFLSFPCEKNARKRLSGDQKGDVAFSVPASDWTASESSGRTHRNVLPSTVATKAR